MTTLNPATLETPATRFTRAYSAAVQRMTRYVLDGDDRKADKAAEMARNAAHGAARYGALAPLVDQMERHYPEISEGEDD